VQIVSLRQAEPSLYEELMNGEFKTITPYLYLIDEEVILIEGVYLIYVDQKNPENHLYQLRYIKELMQSAIRNNDWYSLYKLIHKKWRLFWFNRNHSSIPNEQLFFVFYQLCLDYPTHRDRIVIDVFPRLQNALYLWRKAILEKERGVKDNNPILVYLQDKKTFFTKMGRQSFFRNGDSHFGKIQGVEKVEQEEVLFWDGQSIVVFKSR
jgi:hypothetical protein